MSDLARLPSYPSPTTLIARSGIQFLDFGFDPVRLKVREWGFHDAAGDKAGDDLVQLDFDEVRGQYEVVEGGRRRAAEPNLVVTARTRWHPFSTNGCPCRSCRRGRTTSSARALPIGRGCAWSISRRATARAIATSRAT